MSIELHPIEGRYSVSQKTDFMKKATEAVAMILGCSKEEVVVSFLEYKPESIIRGGIPFSERG